MDFFPNIKIFLFENYQHFFNTYYQKSFCSFNKFRTEQLRETRPMKLKLNISDCRIVQHLTPTISSVENLYGRN